MQQDGGGLGSRARGFFRDVSLSLVALVDFRLKAIMEVVSGAVAPRVVGASRGVERALEEAAGSGSLNLSARKLKEFPAAAAHYDLSDTVHAGNNGAGPGVQGI